jgi:hypothetical protein
LLLSHIRIAVGAVVAIRMMGGEAISDAVLLGEGWNIPGERLR